MSKQQKKIFRFTLVLPFLLLICVIFCLQQHGESAVKEQSEQAKIKRLEASYNSHLRDNVFRHLKAGFDNEKFDEKGAFVADRTVLYSPEGERISGANDILKFFIKLKKEKGITDLTFTIKCVEVFLIEETDAGFDAIAFGIWAYELQTEKDGEIITVDDPGGETDSRHHSACQWEPELTP